MWEFVCDQTTVQCVLALKLSTFMCDPLTQHMNYCECELPAQVTQCLQHTNNSLYSKLCYWTVSQYKQFTIQSTINNSHYHHNTPTQCITAITNCIHCAVLITKAAHDTACFYGAHKFVMFTKTEHCTLFRSSSIKKHTPHFSYIDFNIIVPSFSICFLHCTFLR